MAKRQTRRSVSFSAEMYLSIARAAEEAKMPIARWLEDVAREEIEQGGLSRASRAEALARLRSYPNTRAEQAAEAAKAASTLQTVVSSLSRRCRLTPRQAQCIPLLVRGYTTEEIADEVGISSRTAGQHIRDAFKRIGVASRREIVRAVWDSIHLYEDDNCTQKTTTANIDSV